MCPPIGTSFKKPRYLLDYPQLSGQHHMAKTEERSCSLLLKEQRTMCSLFSPVRCERLQSELCNSIQRGTCPVTQSQEGRLTLRLLSRRSTLTQPPHVLIFHFFLICPSLGFFSYPSCFFLCSCCLHLNPTLIPHYCLLICKQTAHTALLFVFVCQRWHLGFNAGSEMNA